MEFVEYIRIEFHSYFSIRFHLVSFRELSAQQPQTHRHAKRRHIFTFSPRSGNLASFHFNWGKTDKIRQINRLNFTPSYAHNIYIASFIKSISHYALTNDQTPSPYRIQCAISMLLSIWCAGRLCRTQC